MSFKVIVRTQSMFSFDKIKVLLPFYGVKQFDYAYGGVGSRKLEMLPHGGLGFLTLKEFPSQRQHHLFVKGLP